MFSLFNLINAANVANAKKPPVMQEDFISKSSKAWYKSALEEKQKYFSEDLQDFKGDLKIFLANLAYIMQNNNNNSFMYDEGDIQYDDKDNESLSQSVGYSPANTEVSINTESNKELRTEPALFEIDSDNDKVNNKRLK